MIFLVEIYIIVALLTVNTLQDIPLTHKQMKKNLFKRTEYSLQPKFWHFVVTILVVSGT